MWFKRKTAEQKAEELQSELIKLNRKYADVIDSYCMIGSYVFIFFGFKIKDNTIKVVYQDMDTPPTLNNLLEIGWWDIKYGDINFFKYRADFIRFREGLERIGLNLRKQDVK